MFYKVDSTRFSFREYWWSNRSPVVLLAWLIKLLHIPIPSSSADPTVDSLRPFEVGPEAFPEAVRERLQPLITELAACGFQSPVYYAIDDNFHQTKVYRVVLYENSGRAFACIQYRIWNRPYPAKHFIFPLFVSEFNDGTFLVSSAGKAHFEAPASCRINRVLNAKPAPLWTSHQHELAKETTRKTMVPIRTADDVRDAVERYHAALRDFHLKRGVFKPLTNAEEQIAQAFGDSIKASTASGLEHAEVLAQLNQIQEKRTSWGNAIVILAVSIVFFLGAGAARWSWKITLLLIPILLFHEFGHYVAMQIFDYRNVRMFFIPFFGAAVTGKNYNVPGWKKAVVSLMGPLPGIVLGTLLGFAGIVLHKAWLTKVAMLALILNGFNLLPVLPLDGGWVMHATLFSRHYLLDTGFRALAALALIVGGGFSGDRILMYLGIFMLVGLVPAFRLARIAGRLRNRGLPPVSPDDQTIPTETAQVIIGELKQAFPKRVTNQVLAQYTLQVFETLNARPPGWAASLALVFLQVMGGMAALVFAGVFLLGQRSDLRNMVATAATNRAQHKLVCGSDRIWQGAGASGFSTTVHSTLIATFATPAGAEKMLPGFTNALPANAAVRIFGSTLMVALPANDTVRRRKWLADLELVNTNAFVAATNFPAAMALICVAPNNSVAEAIQEEVQEYLSASSSMHLIPPWIAPDARTADERAQHALARHTYAKLQQASMKRYGDPAVVALQKRILQAQKRGDQEELAALRGNMKDLYANLARSAVETVRKEGAEKVDEQVVDLYAALPTYPSTNGDYRAALQAVSVRLGQIPMSDGQPLPGADRYSAGWGTVTRAGLMLNFPWLSLRDAFNGPPAIADWLCSKGCIGLRYDLHPGGSLVDDEEE